MLEYTASFVVILEGQDYYASCCLNSERGSKLRYELNIVFLDLLSEMRLLAAIVLLPLKACYAALCLFSLQSSMQTRSYLGLSQTS